MPVHVKKADSSVFADGVDSSVVDQEEFEVEEEDVEMEEEEEEEEEGSGGEEQEVFEVEEVGEEEEVDEVEEEGDEGEENEGEEFEELEVDGVGREQEEIDEVHEGEEEDEENEEQEAEEGEDEDEVEDGDGGEEEIEEEDILVEHERRGNGEEEASVISADAASAVQDDAKGVVIGSSAVVLELMTYEENEISEILLGESGKGVQLEKEISKESPKSVKSNCLEPRGSHYSVGSDNVRSLRPLKNDLSVEGGVSNESEMVNYNVSEKGESHLQKKADSQLLDNLNLTCGHTPQRRPRSPSPVSERDNMNKKLANICVFYARGWCIKGNSCKFLHPKDGVNKIEQKTKEGRAGLNRAADSLATTGSDEASEKSKVSSVLLESNPKGSLGCHSLLQKALARTYGTGSHVTSQLDDHYGMPTKGEYWQSDHIQASYTSTREEYKKPFGKMSHFESIVERQPDDAFSSRKHMIEGKIINEFNTEDSLCDITISGSTRLADAFVSDSKHYSGSSSISSILHHNSSSPSAHGRTDGCTITSAPGHFLKQKSYNSHSLEGSLNSGLGGSFQFPQMDYRLSQAGTSPTSCSTGKTEYLEGHRLDLDRRYHRSGSISHTTDSSPYHPYPERNMVHQNIPSDLPCRQTTKIQYDDWEPSKPFRPSLAIATKMISSPSQYDPILDSIEPPTANARDCFQSSQMSPFQNVSLLSTKNENSISWEGMLAKNVSLSDTSAHAAADVFITSTKLEGANSSLPSNEKTWNPDQLVDRSYNKDVELGGEWKNIDKVRNIKESKALKIFHTALVDFVKDLLKPWWREGQLSKDAHKTIVKKSVEKVLSTLHSNQIPSTQEAINQYLTNSRPKILKLVDGYAQKHANS